ncbi:putative oxidoreductase/MSMEI_2347 [Mycobacterium simulans]|uniref:Putative oxidoreductase/MSMEI_2347 n=1 Tax=Mycobacterium simulans TaxID=627089 RepID=A0A7Z7N922_9MYCO|nr:putative oxidoreductase/MSMEI_2347 [Mycobacterium simulans]
MRSPLLDSVSSGSNERATGRAVADSDVPRDQLYVVTKSAQTVAAGHPPRGLIRWHIQLGNIVVPKSANPERIASNFDVFDFELSANEMASISSRDDGKTAWSKSENLQFHRQVR